MATSNLNFAALDTKEHLNPKLPMLLTFIGALIVLLAISVSGIVARLVILVIGIVVMAYIGYMAFSNMKKQVTDVLKQFAKDNGFTLKDDPDYKSIGVVFDSQSDLLGTLHKINGTLEDFAFSLYWRPYSFKSTGRHYASVIGVVEIELPKNMPHIFIDRKVNNFLGLDLLGSFSRKNIVELEGKFNKEYRVFYADNYQIATLTILNPSFMSVLLDIGDAVDFEFVDNRLFIYYLEPIPLDEFTVPSESAKSLLNTGQLLIKEFSKQLDTFRFEPDDKMPNEIRESVLGNLVRK